MLEVGKCYEILRYLPASKKSGGYAALNSGNVITVVDATRYVKDTEYLFFSRNSFYHVQIGAASVYDLEQRDWFREII